MEETMKIELKFAGEACTELVALQGRLRAETPAEVIRSALGVLRWATEHLEQNDKILAQDREGHQVEVNFPFLAIGGQD